MKYLHTMFLVFIVLYLYSTCSGGNKNVYISTPTLIDSLLQERLYTLEDSLGRERTRYKILTISAKDFITSQNNEIEDLKKKLKI